MFQTRKDYTQSQDLRISLEADAFESQQNVDDEHHQQHFPSTEKGRRV